MLGWQRRVHGRPGGEVRANGFARWDNPGGGHIEGVAPAAAPDRYSTMVLYRGVNGNTLEYPPTGVFAITSPVPWAVRFAC
jgi:hypothetical protein